LQWLQVEDLSSLDKNPLLFQVWDDRLKQELLAETTAFIESLVFDGDARFESLLSSPDTFVNAVLRDFYGLPVPDPDARKLTPVQFPPEQRRSGVLTLAAVLATQAKADQSSPILRGKFIREQFFCTSPPPPPPDLVVAAPSLDSRLTTRERFEQHRSDPECGGCHELFEPLGLVFENYNAVGQYRDAEEGLPIDVTGTLVDTDVDGEIDGVAELAQRLSSSVEVKGCFTRQWFRYALGRGETVHDQCALDELTLRFEESGGDLRQLVVALTQSPAFLGVAPAAKDLENP
jgi:hypothetical protein